MSMYFAVEIEGLRNPLDVTDGNRVLFVHGDTTALDLPASFTNTTILPLLDNNDPGVGWSSDLREPMKAGGAQSIKLLDTKDGTLGRILLFDPTELTWDYTGSRIEIGQTTIGVSSRSGSPPTVGRFYWIEEECIKVTAVAAVTMGGSNSPTDWALTILRGQCGSRDVVHMISTAAMAPGDPGSETLLTMWQRPNFGAFKFKGTMYLLNSPYAAHEARIVEKKHFFVDQEPLPGVPSYEIQLRDLSEVIENYTFQIGTDTRLTFRMLVVSEGTETTTTAASGGTITTVRKLPNQCKLFLGRLGAAQLFGEPLSEPYQNGFNNSKITSLRTRMQADPNIHYYVKLITRDSEWLFEVTQVLLSSQSIGAGAIPFIEVSLTLRDYPKGQSIDEQPDTGEQLTGDQTIVDTYPNTAFTRSLPSNFALNLIGQQEDPPTLQLWYGLTCSPIDAYLYLTSSRGGFSADPYDAIIGKGLGIPSDWQSRGVAPPAALDVRWDTLDLLELRELLDDTYTYFIKSGDKLGEFLGNLCILHTLLHGPRTDGSLTLRRWARHREGETIPEFNPDISTIVNPGERLTPLRAFLLYSGIKLLTLEPEYVRSVTLGDAAYRESGAPKPVRVWQPGNQLTDQDMVQGQIGHLLRSFFSTMGGSPIRLSISSSVLKQNLEIGDFVLVTNDRLPNPTTGRGMTSVRHIVVGADLNYRTGEKTYRLLRDYFGTIGASVGFIAPTLRPEIPESLGGGVFEIPAGSLGDPSFNPAGDHDGLWEDLEDVGGFIHILNPDIHNPTDQADREGWAEAYGQVIGVVSDGGTGQGRLIVQFDASWDRGGVTVEQLLTPNAIVSLVDRRPADSNPQGALIAPIEAQLSTGIDLLAYSAGVSSFQRNFSQIG